MIAAFSTQDNLAVAGLLLFSRIWLYRKLRNGKHVPLATPGDMIISGMQTLKP
jgi:hypothetical protein